MKNAWKDFNKSAGLKDIMKIGDGYFTLVEP